MQLAAGRTVDDVPSGGAQLFADRVRGLEIALLSALDTPREQLLRLVSIRSS
jgi:hypothetical protein